MSAVSILLEAGVKVETAQELVALVRSNQLYRAWELVQVCYPDQLRRTRMIARVTKIYHQRKSKVDPTDDTEFLVEKCLAYAK